MTTRKDRRVEAAKKRRKQIEDLKIKGRNRTQDRKIRKLRTVNQRGKVVGQKKKMSTFKAQSSYDIAKQQSGSKTGMSNLGSGYKKAEEKFSKEATKKSAKINKAKYPKMGTYKGEGSKTESKTTSTTSTTKKGGKMHAIEKANRKRFGDAHVDKLKARYAEFKKKRKKK